MIGSFGFLAPWMLVALAALPVIWLILRLTPPRPRLVDFPPTRILLGLEDRDRTPARTPWWLTLLRLMLVALIIGALAEPVLRPDLRLTTGTEPLLVVLDNGWDAAPDFADRIAAVETAMAEASRDGRPVSFVATAEPRAESLAAETADATLRRVATAVPRPYLPNRAELTGRLTQSFPERSVEVLWLAGALDGGDAAPLAAAIGRIAARSTIMQSSRPLAVLQPPANTAESVRVPVVRVGGAAGEVSVAGFDQEGRRIVEGSAVIGGNGEGMAEIVLPAEIRNSLARFEISGEDSAGAVQLLDGRWQRKSVGLIVGESAGAAQPLLEPLTYVERALAPTADLIRSEAASTTEAVTALIRRGASIIILTETGTLPPDTTEALGRWIEAGGTLLRFASPNLAATTIEELLPVRLRQGERTLGGSLSWEEPQPVGAFPPGPFARIEVPEDVRVARQVLADPEALRDAEVWAELRDGTPLVTSRIRGDGRIVLFHVTADPRWSNLPLSGAFVEMLQAIVDTSGMVARPAGESAEAGEAAAPWRPVQVLDGYGDLGAPEPGATLVATIEDASPSAETPPGIYDREGTILALNTVEPDTVLEPLVASSIGWQGRTAALEPRPATPIWPWLLAAAAMLAILDGLAVLALSGRLSRRLARAAALALAFALIVPSLEPARAQDAGPNTDVADVEKALAATTKTQLAYVVTGNEELDEASRAGLEGLSMYLADRTALEPGEPAAVDVATDELAFYALLYWPIDADQPIPSAETMARVDTFMKNGGTILFDTRDAGGFSSADFGGNTPENEKLRDILAFVDVPPLEAVPPDHVLTKAFYLLSNFPGRWDASDLWVESLGDAPEVPGRPARGGDGVSPILITGNDFASAWAVDADGLYLFPTVPAEPRQRELAFRSGVNIVMYALTGNYKADQVHVPALLERLGQ